MTTPIFRVFGYDKALEFYVGWLGFQIDWEEVHAQNLRYVQVSRDEVVLHLADQATAGGPGTMARTEIRGLPTYHRQLTEKNTAFARPQLIKAFWNERVLEMEIVDPFNNHLIFCEPGALPVAGPSPAMKS